VETKAVAEADESETVDAVTGWAAKAETKGNVTTDTFRRVGIVDEADYAQQSSSSSSSSGGGGGDGGTLGWLGGLSGGFSSLMGDDEGARGGGDGDGGDSDDEDWSHDGPPWINTLPNAHKRFLIQQVNVGEPPSFSFGCAAF
jgi:hypothetical protein